MKNIDIKSYMAAYFIKENKILKTFSSNKIGVLQFFQRKNFAVVAGIEEVKKLLKNNLNEKYTIKCLQDGDTVSSLEVVLEITGKAYEIYPLEGIIDSILARWSSIATNAFQLKKAANNKPIIMMSDRSDFYLNQPVDGNAAYIGGINLQVTEAQLSLWNKDLNIKPLGTVPHSLIQAFEGNLVLAMEKFNELYPKEKLVGLVDFNNDVIYDSLLIAKRFQKKLYAVRVDTSDSLIDKSLVNISKNTEELKGVNPTLIKLLRKNLDDNKFNYVKIIVSSGFDATKIDYFEKENTPVDIYGVGEALTKITINFTGDAVQIDNKLLSKSGRNKKNSIRIK